MKVMTTMCAIGLRGSGALKNGQFMTTIAKSAIGFIEVSVGALKNGCSRAKSIYNHSRGNCRVVAVQSQKFIFTRHGTLSLGIGWFSGSVRELSVVSGFVSGVVGFFLVVLIGITTVFKASLQR